MYPTTAIKLSIIKLAANELFTDGDRPEISNTLHFPETSVISPPPSQENP